MNTRSSPRSLKCERRACRGSACRIPRPRVAEHFPWETISKGQAKRVEETIPGGKGCSFVTSARFTWSYLVLPECGSGMSAMTS